jgi:hypothetical protein
MVVTTSVPHAGRNDSLARRIPFRHPLLSDSKGTVEKGLGTVERIGSPREWPR